MGWNEKAQVGLHLTDDSQTLPLHLIVDISTLRPQWNGDQNAQYENVLNATSLDSITQFQ